MVILGIEKINYTSKKTGRPVVGTTLYYSEADKNVFGLKTGSIYIPASSNAYDDIQNIAVDDEITLYFDAQGKVAAVNKISE